MSDRDEAQASTDPMGAADALMNETEQALTRSRGGDRVDVMELSPEAVLELATRQPAVVHPMFGPISVIDCGIGDPADKSIRRDTTTCRVTNAWIDDPALTRPAGCCAFCAIGENAREAIGASDSETRLREAAVDLLELLDRGVLGWQAMDPTHRERFIAEALVQVARLEDLVSQDTYATRRLVLTQADASGGVAS